MCSSTLVEDIQLVRQVCDMGSVAFDDQSVADFFDRQVDAGLRVCQVGRIWTHTHPGCCPQPSQTDEDTFARVFGRSDWAVMFILAQGGQSYARLQFNVGPGGGMQIPVEVDYRRAFQASNHAAWGEEYAAHVEIRHWMPMLDGGWPLDPAETDPRFFDSHVEGFENWRDACDDNPGGFLPPTTERCCDGES